MKVAIHQPNFIPWLPFFYKMAMADVFVLLTHVQFEKNGYQNRFKHRDQWITKPVVHGLDFIGNKQYADGSNLVEVNTLWIKAIKETLGIKTKVVVDPYFESKSTQKLIDLVKTFGGDTYITNPEAKDKYLDEERMRRYDINIEYCNVPKHLRISIFEAFEKFGIEGIVKQLPKKEKNEILSPVF